METQQQTEVQTLAGFHSKDGFELLQRMAKMLASSDLVPVQFKGNIANCVIGLEMAHRMNASPLAVMQNIYIVHGKPSWSAQFITAAINSTGHFSPLRFRVEGSGDQKTCTAWAIEKATGEQLEGPPVSIGMAKAEGWFEKNGSKWKTMPDLMLRYRAATFFGRLYAPEVLMGMKTQDEIEDISTSEISPEQVIAECANTGPILEVDVETAGFINAPSNGNDDPVQVADGPGF
jgi:hypothetical protein